MAKRILSIIPARGGSSGLPRKNIINLAGKPLISWTIEASLKSKYITKTVVSSDDKEILDIAKEYGSDIIKRPDDLATDTATSVSVVKHVIYYLESRGEEFDIIILLQPTSPLRDVSDIDNSFDRLFKASATSLISVKKVDNKILKAFIICDNNHIKSISNKEFPFMRRQDLPKTVISNGAIYIVDVKTFKEEMKLISDKTLYYVMPENRSIDVDSVQDLLECSKVLNVHY
jgi:CMP-N,N'-diacetyllegionaminic acid synthase